MNLAIIPARGGSKGIAGKNLRVVCGVSLLGRCIKTAKRAELVDRVVVSTDDRSIAREAERYGAQVVWRPAELATDTASSESVLLHVLGELDYQPDVLVFLQCTAPLMTPADIDRTVQTLSVQGADTAFAAARAHTFRWNADGTGINHDPSKPRQRRQDLPPRYVEAGSVYAMRAAGFMEARNRFFGRTAIYEIPAERVLEIDEPQDLIVAEALVREHQTRNRRALLPAVVKALVLDFDGVLTDDQVYTFHDGREAVRCSRSDGYGLSQLKIPVLVISREIDNVVYERCSKLNLEHLRGVQDKLPALHEWAAEKGIDLGSIVYVGNDVPDVECLLAVGGGVAVADAHPAAKRAAKLTLRSRGGDGAVRELCDLLEGSR